MKLLTVNGSPRRGSSTEILISEFTRGFVSLAQDVEVISVCLNDLDIIPCQACGINPAPLRCIYFDQLYPYLRQLEQADMLLVGSPVYFDTVSAQTKLFIDRTNCFRPPAGDGGFDNSRLLGCKGAYILVGGKRQQFETAERVIGGMFIWLGIKKIGKLIFSTETDKLGAAGEDIRILTETYKLGKESASRLMADSEM